jgi:hypothetical protein
MNHMRQAWIVAAFGTLAGTAGIQKRHYVQINRDLLIQ